jgi:DNA-binding MarR family transcriptional regulator
MVAREAAGVFSLLHVAARVEGYVESRLASVGLSVPKLEALHQLVVSGEPLPLGQLAERLACVKSNVTQLVDRLEADGLVARAPDPNDRRSRLAVITETGRASYSAGIDIERDAEREVFGILTPGEASQLADIIGKIGRQC